MKAKSYNFNNLEGFNLSLVKDLSEGFAPTLAICFADANFDFKSLDKLLKKNNIDAIGSTTCGEICDDGFYENSCSALLLELPKDAYHLEIEKFSGDEDLTSEKIAQVAINKFSDPAIITYASKVGVNGDRVVRGYKKVLKKDAPIFGGLAGDDFKNEEFTVFANNTFETDGLAALIIDSSKIKVEGNAFSGWEELGKTHTVTKAIGNTVYSIDDQPALSLFIEYFGIEQSNTNNGQPLEIIPGIYPLKVIDENEVDYMRSPLLYDRKKQSLILGGEVKEGEKVKFCPMPTIETVTETISFFKEYAEKLPKVDSIIINSCAGRKFAFGPLMNKEIEEIYNIWDAPTIGLMALGEFGNNGVQNECNFHNVTCSLVTLTEIV